MSHGAGKTGRQKHWDLFDPKSQHYKSHTKNVIGWQERERWEIGSEGEQRTRDLWKSSAGLFVLGASSEELFHSLPFFSSLEISKCNRECAEGILLLLQNEWCPTSNRFGVQLDKNHAKRPLSSEFSDDFKWQWFSPSPNHIIHFWQPGSPSKKTKFVQEITEPDQRREKRSRWRVEHDCSSGSCQGNMNKPRARFTVWCSQNGGRRTRRPWIQPRKDDR